MSDKKTIFDDWSEVVDCNNCAHYWDNSCDGPPQGSRRLCNSFLATRSVVIPAQIESLRTQYKRLRMGLVILGVIEIIHIILGVIG